MTTLRAVPRPCGHSRCKRLVATVTMLTARGAGRLDIDAEPSTWELGARIKLIASDHLPEGRQLAEKLTQSQIHRAFAVKALYVPHVEVCQAAQKRTAASKRAGHA